MILDKIVEKVKEQIAAAKRHLPLSELKLAPGIICPPGEKEPGRFMAALQKSGLSIIAEVKKASPSKGVIAADFDPVRIAKAYQDAEVAAISVLTEEHFFQGSLDYLRAITQAVTCPILRKDFIIDPYQIYQARHYGAHAILLIAALLDVSQMKDFIQLAASLGLDALCEVHNQKELDIVLSAEADIIGINNRNLHTFEVTLATTLNLIDQIPRGKIIISESGIKDHSDILCLQKKGVTGVLVGETLMRAADKRAKINELMGV